MNSVASLISGQFTRSLILGAFFPVVLFLFFGYLFLEPLLPAWQPVILLHKLDTQAKAGIISAAAVVATIFLYNLNTPIMRFLEGYQWQLSRYGRARIEHWRAEFDGMTALLPRLRMLRAHWDSVDKQHADRRNVQDSLNRLQEVLNAQYPFKPHLILPTRFGNLVRSFETYPLRQYAIDGVTLWPHIISVADKDKRDAVDDAKSSLDFFVNCAMLSAILSALLFVTGCCVLNGGTPVLRTAAWAVEVLGSAALSRMCYAACHSKIADWGGEVKSVFDLFRPELLKKLGYTQTPGRKEEERLLWGEISRQMIYGDPTATGKLLPYEKAKEVRTTVASENAANLELTSGVTRRHGILTFTRRVVNKGTSDAQNVCLSEQLPEGYEYVWDSVKKDNQVWQISGTNPYELQLGTLSAGVSVSITYEAVYLARGGRSEPNAKKELP